MKTPSIRAQKYAKNVVNGMSGYRAALQAGYTPATAKNAKKNVENHGISQTILDALEKAGVSNELLAERLMEGLGATRYQLTPKGVKEVPDFATRQRYLQLGLALLPVPANPEEPLVIHLVSYDEKLQTP